MADTRYLQKRGNSWYIRIPKPPRLWGRTGEFVCSLNTPDLKTAQTLRDKYLIPLLAETSAVGMVSTIIRLLANGNEAVSRQIQTLRGDLAGFTAEPLTLREARDQFVAHLESSRGHSPSSIGKLGTNLHAACRLRGDTDVERVTKADTRRFRDTLLALPANWQRKNGHPAPAEPGVAKLSPSSVKNHLRYLRQLFRWLIDEGRVARRDNPVDGINIAGMKPNGGKRAPTSVEADGLLRLTGTKAIEALTWRMMPAFARYTGCRAGELAQLRRDDVVTKQGIRCLRITARGAKTLKTVSSERLVPVSERLSPLLDELLGLRPDGALFRAKDWHGADGTIKYAHGFLHTWNRKAKAVAPDLSFHCLRVYANDAMATAGVDILDRERILGHKSTRTQAAYTPENLSRLKRAVDTVP